VAAAGAEPGQNGMPYHVLGESDGALVLMTAWTRSAGAEAMDYGRPIAQWPRLEAGRYDSLKPAGG
jgi:alpha-beta hydrolase superfamily lysophospholipase